MKSNAGPSSLIHRPWSFVLCLLCAVFWPPSSLHAQTPQLINYQGRLVQGTNLVNGNVGLSLRLFNLPSGGTSIYEDSNSVTVADGLYSTFIGDNTTSGDLNGALTNAQVWLEVAVNGTALSPRERMVSVSYSLATRGLLVTTNGSFVHNPTENAIDPAAGHSTIGGGEFNTVAGNAAHSFVGGGYVNTAGGIGVTIPGGFFNNTGTNAPYVTVGGGYNNRVRDNSAAATIAGGGENDIRAGSFDAVIGGGRLNLLWPESPYATIAGGGNNEISSNSTGATVGGGQINKVTDQSSYAAIGGGYLNSIGRNSPYSVIGGGNNNTVSNNSSGTTISGGNLNRIGSSSFRSVVAGGSGNEIGNVSPYAVVSGGLNNDISSNAAYAILPGGRDNAVGAGAANALAAGTRAKANHVGAFVWADSQDADFASTAINQFLIRASGGVGIGTNETPELLTVAGNVLAVRFIGDGSQLINIPATAISEADPVWTAASNAIQAQITAERLARIGADFAFSNSIPGKLDSNVWALAGSTTNYVRRTGDTNSGPLSLPAGGLAVGLTQLVVNAQGNVSSSGTVTALSFIGGGSGLSGLSGGQLAAGTISNVHLAASAITNIHISTNSITGDKIADGTVSNADLSAQTLSNTFWRLDGNAGTTVGTHFLGTTDSRPVEIRVNNLRALRIEPGSAPNLIGGLGSTVTVGQVGVFIGGGTINTGRGSYATIGGGRLNDAGSADATIGGGQLNSAGATGSTVGGGQQNSAGGTQSSVGGGIRNSAGGAYSTVAGGSLNSADFQRATVGGGEQNMAGGDWSFIGGGYRNTNRSSFATVSGGQLNSIGMNSAYSAVGGGYDNNVASDSSYATIAGGFLNDIGTNSGNSAVGGGRDNNVADNSESSTIAGGFFNRIGKNSLYATVGGGTDNSVDNNSPYATIAGGTVNNIGTNADYAVIGGGQGNRIQQFVGESVIGGGVGNEIQSLSERSFLGGGAYNKIGTNSLASFLGGGADNRIEKDATAATLGGGSANTIGAGSGFSFLGGGEQNKIGTNSYHSTVGGGFNNNVTNNAPYAAIPGGRNNAVGNSATNAFAAGRRAKANHPGAFVWADITDADFASTAANQFLVRASGGVGINATAPEGTLHVTKGSAGSVTADGNSIAVLENSGNGYLTLLTPVANENGILFGNPTSPYEGGILYNSGNTRGLQFRTGGNFTRMVITSNGFVGINTTAPAAALDVVGSFRVNGGTTFSRIQDGTFNAGGSVGGFLVVTGSFPVAFGTVPNIVVSTINDVGYPDVSDTFCAAIRRITTTNFVVNIQRVDSNSGWSQNLRVAWHAWE